MSKRIQIQAVLYKNDLSALEQAICNISNAIINYRKTGGNIECYVVYGDASPDRLMSEALISDWSEKYALPIHYRFFGENTGTAKGHNQLARECKAEYIMDMNPDVLVSPDFFREILKPFEDNSVGLVESRQSPLEHPKDYNYLTGETSWSSTACVVFTKKVFDLVGGFDDKCFFMYCDDVDFSWRIRQAGLKVIYQPRAVVYHAKRLSNEGAWKPTEAEKYYSAEAAIMMAYKWSNRSLLARLLYDYKKSKDVSCKKALKVFIKKKKNGQLPKPIKDEENIATFIEGGYAKHRFIM